MKADGTDRDTILTVSNLTKHFPITKGLTRRRIGTVRAVDDVSFEIRRGEVFGLVGESGCGKTTTGRTVLRAIEPTDGQALFQLDAQHDPVDIFALGKNELREIRRRIRMIFQDPFSALNPRMNVREIITEPLRIHGLDNSRSETEDRVARLLKMVGMDPSYMRRYPHAFSGGQRQRLCIARALVLDPTFIVADEPVSALDVSVQAQILNLMQDLQTELGLTYLFIAHNLAVVEHVCDRIGVMYVGKLVEVADTEPLYRRPRHPYTEALMESVPRSEPGEERERRLLTGEVADPGHPPPGCYFHPRCRYAQDICRTEHPPLRDVSEDPNHPHLAACHFAEQLELAGITPAAT
jgi:peptide/nickel transport system ATP-binding protein